MTANSTDALPAYRLQVSRRARHVKIKVLPYEGLVVVVPKGYSHARVDSLLWERRQWIRKAFDDLHNEGICTWPLGPSDLPETLTLPAIHYERPLAYVEQAGDRLRIHEFPDRLELHGPVARPSRSQQALQQWLRRRARRELGVWLDRISEATGLAYQRLSIRGQKSRWGSCSSEGNISLNYKLLFLPPEKVSYILLHELCHLRHMNHSPRFWQFMESLLPGAREVDRQCQHAWQYIPHWVEATFI